MIFKHSLDIELRSFYKTIIGMAGVRAAVIIISFIGSIILTRSIGAEGRGIFAWFISTVVICSALVQFGMEGVNRRFVAQDNLIAGSLARFTIKLCFIGLVIITPFFIYYGLSDEIGRENKLMLVIANITIFFMAICQSLCGTLLGLHRTKQYSISMAAQKIINTILIVLIALIGWVNPLYAIIILLISHIAQASLNIFFLRNELKNTLNNKINNNNKDWREVIPNIKSYSTYLYISSILTITAMSIIPILLAQQYSLRSAGLFATAMIIIDAILRTFGIINLYSVPKLAGLKNAIKRKKLRNNIQKTAIIGITLIAIIWFFIADWVIILLFGDDFKGAINVLQILCIAMIFFALNNVYSAFIRCESSSIIIIIAPAMMLITILAAAYYYIPLYGAIGGAISLAIGAFSAMMSAIISYRYCIND